MELFCIKYQEPQDGGFKLGGTLIISDIHVFFFDKQAILQWKAVFYAHAEGKGQLCEVRTEKITISIYIWYSLQA